MITIAIESRPTLLPTVLFMGVVMEPLCIVTEFCVRGNLFDLLHDAAVPLSWKTRLQMAVDAARGMNCKLIVIP